VLFCVVDIVTLGEASIIRGVAVTAGKAILRAEARDLGKSLVESVATRGAERTIPWSSRAVRDAVGRLERGATEVRVGSRAEAEEVFLGRYQGEGYRNTTGMSPTEAKGLSGGKEGTYHWDIGENAYPHGESHLQVHTYGGDVVRIFIP